MDSYRHRPLLPGPTSIRLLELLPGEHKAEIRCRIFEHQLTGPDNYEALSYVWGDQNQCERIFIEVGNTITFLDVTVNLFAALRRLRSRSIAKTLWIDGICIDQSDHIERAAQVRIMATIYTFSRRVIIWLGEEADGSSIAMAKIHDDAAAALREDNALVNSISSREDLDSVPGSKDWIMPLVALLNRSWFGRIWILQEAAAARSATVLCGEDELTDQAFTRGLRSLRFWSHENDKLRIAFHNVHAVMSLMGWTVDKLCLTNMIVGVQTNVPPSLSILPLDRLLDMFRFQAASDHRDKVYALLGMGSDPSISQLIVPDYEQTWSELVQKLVALYLGPRHWVTTTTDEMSAVILANGLPLGPIICANAAVKNQQMITVSFGSAKGPASLRVSICLTVPVGFQSIKTDDILCLLKDSQRPIIIRPCHDHFDIISISVPTPENLYVQLDQNRAVSWTQFRENIAIFDREFLLVWSWEQHGIQSDQSPHGDMQKSDIDEIGIKGTTMIQIPGNPVARNANNVRILDDVADLTSIRRLVHSDAYFYSPPSPDKRYLIEMKGILYAWSEYRTLRRHVADVFWFIWLTTQTPPSSSDSSKDLLDYWNINGFLAHDMWEILELQPLPQIPRRGGDMNVKIYGKLTDLAASLFPGYRKGQTFRTHVTTFILEMEKGNIRLNDAIISAAMTGPRYAPGSTLPLTIVLEMSNKSLKLSDENLRAAARYPEKLSLLLQELSDDIPTVYGILNAAWKDPNYTRAPSAFHDPPGAAFFVRNDAIIRSALRNSQFCQLAHHQGNAKLLQFLQGAKRKHHRYWLAVLSVAGFIAVCALLNWLYWLLLQYCFRTLGDEAACIGFISHPDRHGDRQPSRPY